MDIKIRHLRLIHAIQREGSLSLAARSLGVTQPAVSHGLKELEGEFAVRLFERGTGGVRVTEAGRRLSDAADRVLGILDRVSHDLRQLGTGSHGTLRITTECYTCYHWLPAVLARFRSAWPGFELRLVPEAKTEPRRALKRRELDLAITHSIDNDPEFQTVPLFGDELVAIAAPEHPLAARPFLVPHDFADHPLIMHSDPRNSLLFHAFLFPAGVEPGRVTTLQLTEAVVAAVRAALGISVLARWVVTPELDAGTLVAIPLGETGLQRRWSVTVLAEQRAHPPIAALIELLQQASLSSATDIGSRNSQRDPGPPGNARSPPIRERQAPTRSGKRGQP